jgi:hypothetical protein
MGNQPPFQQQVRQQTKQSQQTAELKAPTTEAPPALESAASETPLAVEAPAAIAVDEQSEARTKAGFKAEEAKLTAGRSGERNVAVEWIDVWIGNNRPMRFIVKTAPGNALEIVIQQASYRKTYSGTGSISTQVVPVVPIGTKGNITILDMTTGETLEQSWKWISLGGSGGFSLWAAIKRLLGKST